MSPNITRADLSDAVYRRHGGLTRREAKEAVDALIATLRESLARGRAVKIPNFGVFEVVERAPRRGVNPATGRPMMIPAGKALSFRAARKLKERIASDGA